MSDWYHNFSQQLQKLSHKIAFDGKRYLRSVLNKGEEIKHKGKIQLELEKLKWELKQKQSKLGKYVSDKKINASVTDFSHDSIFLDLVSEVHTLKMYMDERKKQRQSINT